MRKLAPLTKLISVLVVTVWSFVSNDAGFLAAITTLLTATALSSQLQLAHYKAMLKLALFAGLLTTLQVVFGVPTQAAINAGLRMLIMTYLFFLLLSTTRIQDLTAALVKQCKIPYEYAFMLTASLRFIPDILSEIKAVQEAQACRGYTVRGSLWKRLLAYLSIVQPLVLRSISRSETMAMALELRGFGNQRRTFAVGISLTAADYALLTIVLAGSLALAVY